MNSPTLPSPASLDPELSATQEIDRRGDGVPVAIEGNEASGLTGPQRLGGRYEILGLIGVGGMGNVYRARDVELEEIVALKMLRRELSELPGALDRFRREVKLARRVTHRNVARAFDIGEHDGEKFLTMEYVEGESLAALLRREGRLPVARLVEIASAICAGLQAAHAAEVVHRDLKPDNILLSRRGRVVITDFGIAFARDRGGAGRTLGTIGTPAYMAPEQVEGTTAVDGRADLYALGVILYEMATGALPWGGGSPFTVASARLNAAPPEARTLRADLPVALSQTVRRCMAREPADRFPDAEALALALAAALASPGETLPGGATPSAPARPDREARKTVAVLPFRNAGPAESAYLVDGLTDDLIDTLSMTTGLRVRSRGVVERTLDGATGSREVGRQLGVQVVVEGTVRVAASGLRISTRLISVADGFQIWARRFERPASQVIAVAEEVAAAIAAALAVQSVKGRAAPNDPQTLDLFLRARHQYRRLARAPVQAAVELYEQALARAPDDPAILGGYAIARVRLWYLGGEGAHRSAELARSAAERAVAAAPEQAEPRLALAEVRYYSGEVAAAVGELRRAIAAAPDLAAAHTLLARIALEAGALDEAARLLEAALAAAPGDTAALVELARSRALTGDFTAAEALLRQPEVRAGEERPIWLCRIRLALWQRDAAAIEQCAQTPAVGPGELPLVESLFHLVRHGRLPETPLVDEALADLSADGRLRRAQLLLLAAEGAAYVGDHTRTLAVIEGAVAAGLADLGWADHCPLLAPLRGQPGFLALRQRIAARAAPVIAALAARDW